MRSQVLWEDPGLPEKNGIQNSVQDLDFSRDGEALVVAVANLVLIYDTKTGDLISRLRGHKDTVYSVAFVRDGTRFASGGADKTIKIWDTRSNNLIQHYEAHTASVNSVSFHPSGNYLISSSADNTLKVWDLREGHLMYTLQGHAAAANSSVFSPNGDFFASAADDAIVMVWRTNFDRVSPGSVANAPEAPVETENRAPVAPRPKTAPAKTRVAAVKKSRRPSSGRPLS